MDRHETVLILMSTYNGEKYLKEQLNSIYKQDYPNIQIYVRDDDSCDSTTQILEEEQKKNKLTWYHGKNLGAAHSFWELVQHAPEADFYAFSDQDDFWLCDKISSAIHDLPKDSERPALYFCQTQLTNEHLEKTANVKLSPKLTYGEALFAQFVGGCTMVFNNGLRRKLQTYTPKNLFMHDFWIYNVALALDAKITFDPTPHILYRQHTNNAVGQSNSLFFLWKSRIKRFIENKHIRSNTAQDLWDGYYKEMSAKNRKITLWAANCPHNTRAAWHVLTSPLYNTFSRKTDLYSRLAVLLHTF